MYLHDNGLAVNFASLTAGFFAISAVFHLWALIVGFFERWWFICTQMDDAFCPGAGSSTRFRRRSWPWPSALPSGCASSFSILAGIFMLHWCTMAFGFLVEYIAVPKYMLDTTALAARGRLQMDRWEQDLPPPTPIERMRNDPRALKLISQDQWNMDRPLYDAQTDTLLGTESDLYVRQQREQTTCEEWCRTSSAGSRARPRGSS